MSKKCREQSPLQKIAKQLYPKELPRTSQRVSFLSVSPFVNLSFRFHTREGSNFLISLYVLSKFACNLFSSALNSPFIFADFSLGKLLIDS